MGYYLALPFMEQCYGCTRRERQMASARDKVLAPEVLVQSILTGPVTNIVRGWPGHVGLLTRMVRRSHDVQAHRCRYRESLFFCRTGVLAISLYFPPLFSILPSAYSFGTFSVLISSVDFASYFVSYYVYKLNMLVSNRYSFPIWHERVTM